jgi:hypothetical protein
LVGGQKNLAFEQQGARHMQEIYGPSTDFFRFRRRQLARTIHGQVHFHDQLFQCASLHPTSQARQGSVSFAADSCSLARREYSPLVKSSLPNSIFDFQSV